MQVKRAAAMTALKREAPVVLSAVAVLTVTALTLGVLYPQAGLPGWPPPDIYPAALFGLLVLGPAAGVVLTYAEGMLWVLVARNFGPFLAPPAPGRRFFLRLADVDPVLYAGIATAALLIALLLKRTAGGTIDFQGIAQGSFGDATWMSLEASTQILPPDGEVVIGECARPDLEKEIAGRAFDPKDRGARVDAPHSRPSNSILNRPTY